MTEAIGIMDKAYFVGKKDVLSWINTTLQCNIDKVEDSHSAWVYCQIMDSIFPGQVPLHRVNFAAKTEYEKIGNYKVLQDIFAKNDIKKHIDVGKLVKGKFQDNMEFCQWLKHYHSIRAPGNDYPGLERRNEAIQSYGAGHKHAVKSLPTSAVPAESNNSAPSSGRAKVESKPLSKPASSSAKGSDDKSHEQTQKIAKLRIAVEGLEKERDFYFGKLRDIEILCQNEDQTDIKALRTTILDILYKTDDEDFVPPPEAEDK